MVQLIPPPPYNPQTGLTALQTQEDAHNRQAVAAGIMSPADYENHKMAQQQGNITAQQAYQQQLQAQQNQRQAQDLAVWNAANPPRGFTVHTVRNGVPGTIVMSTAGEQPGSFNPDPTRPATGSYEQQALAYKDDQNRMPAISASAQTAQSGMMRLNELANIIPQLATGPTSELRARGAAWLEQLGASPETIKTWTGMQSGSLAEELIKLSVATVGQAAKADLGSNVGIQSLQLYQSANPGISLLPDANKRMTNMARVSAQMTQDYAQGAQQHFNENQHQFLTDNAYAHPLSEYDQQWQQRNNPHVGAGAMGILNGDSFDKWALRVTPEEAKQAVAMAYRIDPTTMVPTAKGPVPASQILGVKSGG
jgi:hypothetical protein